MHAPYRIAEGRIRLGGVVFGIAAEVRDPRGSMWTVLDSMDGTRTVEQIVALVLDRHPGESPAAVHAWVDQFIASGYVEDADEADPAELTPRDKIRYDRSRRFFRWVDLDAASSTWRPQVALRRARVAIVGLGGTGGNAALALAASGVGRLLCVDYDMVELSNLNRQLIYTEEDIGQLKVDAAVRRLRQLNTDIDITGSGLEVTGEHDIAALARECDALLLCADRPRETRIWTNRGCLATGTPWVDAGYHGPLVQVATYIPHQGPCWECLRAVRRERHRAEGANPHDGAQRREATPNAVGATSAGVSGHLAAQAVISLLTGAPPAASGQVRTVNLFDLSAPPLTVTGPRRPDCPSCGASP